jgi:inosose dehydratase
MGGPRGCKRGGTGTTIRAFDPMKNLADQLGIQSYCFRGFKTLGEVLPRLKACGVSTVELSGVHGDFTREAAAIIASCRAAGVRIASIGVERFTGNAERDRKLGDFMRQAGASVIAVDFLPDAGPDVWRGAERVADEFDLRLAIHNHGGRHWLGNTQMLAQVFANTSPRIGLCLDTAWALDAHEDPMAMAQKFGERLYGVHLKDFVFDRAGRPSDAVLGEGNLDLPKLLTFLQGNEPTASVIIEYEGDIANPGPALTQCVQKVAAGLSF